MIDHIVFMHCLVFYTIFSVSLCIFVSISNSGEGTSIFYRIAASWKRQKKKKSLKNSFDPTEIVTGSFCMVDLYNRQGPFYGESLKVLMYQTVRHSRIGYSVITLLRVVQLVGHLLSITNKPASALNFDFIALCLPSRGRGI